MKLLLLYVLAFSLLLFGCNNKVSGDLNKVLNEAVEKRNASLCSSGNLDSVDENACYYAYARETGDSDACEKVSWISNDISISRNGCYLQVARKTLNESTCEKISPVTGEEKYQIKNLCYYELGIAKKDSGVCEKMTADYVYYCPPCPMGAVCSPCHAPATKQECVEKAKAG